MQFLILFLFNLFSVFYRLGDSHVENRYDLHGPKTKHTLRNVYCTNK